MGSIDLPIILIAALIAAISLGPATLAIAATSMTSGRKYGLALASGIITVSFIWSIGAAFGMAALMATNVWAFELIRYFGAAYLLFLAYKSARSVFNSNPLILQEIAHSSIKKAYLKGLAIHITNPKAVLFFGSLYAIGVPADAPPLALAIVILAIGIQGILIFYFYAILFSIPTITRGYFNLRRWFESLFAIAFAGAGLKILTTRLHE